VLVEREVEMFELVPKVMPATHAQETCTRNLHEIFGLDRCCV